MFFFSSDANKEEYLKDTPMVTIGYKELPVKIMKVKDWKINKDHIKKQEKYWNVGTNVDTVIGEDGEIVGYSVQQRGFIK